VSKEVKCPLCIVGNLSWHDTALHKDTGESSRTNETDQGDHTPYFMCSNGTTCGFTVSVRQVDKLRKVYQKVMA